MFAMTRALITRTSATIAVVLSLFACGGGDDDGAAAPTGTQAPASATTEAPEPGPTTTEAPDPGSVEDATRLQLEQAGAGQWGRLYATLHPLQQELVSEAAYVACAEEQGWGGYADAEVEIDETYPEQYTIPGVDVVTPTTAVTFTLSIDGESFTDTMHLVVAEGSWRWFLADPSVCMTDV